MVPKVLFYQLFVIALLVICLLIHVWWHHAPSKRAPPLLAAGGNERFSRGRSGYPGSSPPTDWPDGSRLCWRQLDLFRFMADHETCALTQCVGHCLQPDLDLQPLPTVGQGKL